MKVLPKFALGGRFYLALGGVGLVVIVDHP